MSEGNLNVEFILYNFFGCKFINYCHQIRNWQENFLSSLVIILLTQHPIGSLPTHVLFQKDLIYRTIHENVFLIWVLPFILISIFSYYSYEYSCKKTFRISSGRYVGWMAKCLCFRANKPAKTFCIFYTNVQL